LNESLQHLVKRTRQPRPLNSFLGRDSHLRQLVKQAQADTDLLRTVRDCLPVPLDQHCHAAHIQDDQLVLFTDSPAWVMRFRFCTPQILAALHKTRPNLRGVRVRVQLAQRSRPRVRHRPQLSQGARDMLRETAAGVDNPGLKAALERLSKLPGRED
jgi:hypothetical protein